MHRNTTKLHQFLISSFEILCRQTHTERHRQKQCLLCSQHSCRAGKPQRWCQTIHITTDYCFCTFMCPLYSTVKHRRHGFTRENRPTCIFWLCSKKIVSTCDKARLHVGVGSLQICNRPTCLTNLSENAFHSMIYSSNTFSAKSYAKMLRCPFIFSALYMFKT